MARIPNSCTVWLEGIEMNFVSKFNIAEGWVECFTNSPSGYSNMCAERDEFMTSRLYGNIEVEFN